VRLIPYHSEISLPGSEILKAPKFKKCTIPAEHCNLGNEIISIQEIASEIVCNTYLEKREQQIQPSSTTIVHAHNVVITPLLCGKNFCLPFSFFLPSELRRIVPNGWGSK
jgi:hypothetical protein